MSGRASSTQEGFTLLELIVVIGIFAIMAAMAYGGLKSVLDMRSGLEAKLGRTEEFQRAYQRLRMDFANAAPRSIRDNDGQSQPPFLWDGYFKRVEFTRGGWANPLALPRATLERVAYFLDDKQSDNRKLVRRSWRVLDRAPQTEPIDLPLIEHIDEAVWRFMDKNRDWQEAWPPEGTSRFSSAGSAAQTEVPLAVELRLRTRDWNELRLVFQLGAEGYSLMGQMQQQLQQQQQQQQLQQQQQAPSNKPEPPDDSRQ
jgi:general secretion pathway protein J